MFDDGGSLSLVRVLSMEETAGILEGVDTEPFVRDKDGRDPAGVRRE